MNWYRRAAFPAILALGVLLLTGRILAADLPPARPQNAAETAAGYATETAERLSADQTNGPYETQTALAAGGGGGQQATQAPVQGGQPPAPATTPTNTATFTATIVTPGRVPTPTSGSTQAAGTAAPTATRSPLPTATPTVAGAGVCQPGVPFTVVGTAPARAPLLLFFNGRPVGGGSTGSNGQFALALTVGRERPGVYPISVRIRGDGREVLRTTCQVVAEPTRVGTPTARSGG